MNTLRLPRLRPRFPAFFLAAGSIAAACEVRRDSVVEEPRAPVVGEIQVPAAEVREQVGWVHIGTSTGASLLVRQNGRDRGYTSVVLTQRPGIATYEVLEGTRVVCHAELEVMAFQDVCVACDTESGLLRRVQCP